MLETRDILLTLQLNNFLLLRSSEKLCNEFLITVQQQLHGVKYFSNHPTEWLDKKF